MLAWCLLACGHHLLSVKPLKDASYFCWFVSSISGHFSFFALTRAMLFITGRHSFPFMDIIQEWMLLDSYRSIICSCTYPEEHCHTTQLHKHIYSCVCKYECVPRQAAMNMCVCVCPCPCIDTHVLSSVQSLSHVRLFATTWTVARWAPLSMEFSRQGYWTGLPSSSPGDLPNPGLKPRSLITGRFFTFWTTREVYIYM